MLDAARLFRFAVVLLIVGAGCASETSNSVSTCQRDLDCPVGESCVNALCVGDETGRDAGSDSVPRQDTQEDTREDGSRTDAVDDDTGREPGDILLDPCREQADCPGGYCIGTPNGDRCTRGCTMDTDCAGAPGWRCTLIRTPGFDLERVCYPAETQLCEACVADTDCGGLTDRCVSLPGGAKHCGLDCGLSELCPPGFYCAVQPNDSRQCVPVNNDCGPCLFANLQEDVDHCGAC